MRDLTVKIIPVIITVVFVGGLLFFWYSDRVIQSQAQNSRSSDAIAVKVIPNPDYLSAREWYDRQGFAGSPQSLTVDGYRAIREGRTVYVNAANIDNRGTDSASDDLYYANIYLISYNQQAESATQDIFSRILKNWKFNSNLSASGVCADHPEVSCRGEADCPVGDYCLSRKAGVTRDTIRLADLRDIQAALEAYNRDNGHYPLLRSGSYLPHKTISVWPSWQKLLAQYLDGQLPEDPINRLGECGDGYNPRTCWNEAAQSLSPSVDLDDYDFPAYSRIYSYRTNETGTEADYCVLLESDYENISHFNCEAATDNNPPILDGSNLTGDTKEEFTGYISAHDPDGDELAWEVNLHTPDSSAVWSGLHQWQWDQGHSGFSIREAGLPTQRILHAAQAGNASQPGDYQLEVVLSDGNGGVTREILDVDIRPVPMQINEVAGEVVIGNSGQFTFQGTDMSMNDLALITYQDASFDNGASVSGLSESQLNSHGFSLNGMNVDVDYAPAQQTGQYSIDILAPDPVFAPDGIESTAAIRIVNNPPRIEAFRANYVDGSHGPCERGDGPCEMHIDNMEPATVSVMAEDEDGHNLTYSFLSAPQELSINPDTGEITGLELLNQYEIERASHNIEVEVRDEYCGQSSGGEEECQDQWQFTLWVMPYCGAAVPESYSTVDYPDEFLLVDQPGLSTAETLGINSCSEIGEGTVDLAIRGVTNDRVIIFVLDMSLSMDTPIFPPGAPAVDLMKEKVAGDVLDTLHEAAMTLEGNNDRIHAALVTFNRNTWYYLSSGPGMLDAYSLDDEITESYFFDVSNDDGELDVLHDTIWNLDTWQETNILNGLNAAEMLISGADDLYPGADKTVVLLSDGHPIIGVITPYYRWTIWCDSTRDECSCGTGSPGDPIIIGQADSDKAVGTIQADNPDFSIAVTDPITECPYDYSQTPERIEELEGRHENGDCLESEAGDNCCNTWHFTRAYPTQECVITNVGAQADWIKSPSGGDANLYTIYYNTGSEGAEESERDMCLWSSEDDSLCDPYDPDANDYRFAFASSDVDALFDSVMDSIFNKPNGIYVNETTLIEDPDPRQVVTEKTLCINDPDNPVCEGSENISDVDCSMEELSGFFEQGQGELVFSNLHLDYCPAKLH